MRAVMNWLRLAVKDVRKQGWYVLAAVVLDLVIWRLALWLGGKVGG